MQRLFMLSILVLLALGGMEQQTVVSRVPSNLENESDAQSQAQDINGLRNKIQDLAQAIRHGIKWSTIYGLISGGCCGIIYYEMQAELPGCRNKTRTALEGTLPKGFMVFLVCVQCGIALGYSAITGLGIYDLCKKCKAKKRYENELQTYHAVRQLSALGSVRAKEHNE